MIAIQNEIEQQGLSGKMIMQVHDELVFDIPKSEIQLFKEIIQDKMTNAIKTNVPLVVEIGEGKNWLEAH